MIFDQILTLNLLGSTAVFYAAARLYLLPRLGRLSPRSVLLPILLLHSLRHLGLMFLTRGAVNPGMPLEFAYPAATGDLITAILAFAAIPVVAGDRKGGRPLVQAFNTVGTLDLLLAISLATHRTHGARPRNALGAGGPRGSVRLAGSRQGQAGGRRRSGSGAGGRLRRRSVLRGSDSLHRARRLSVRTVEGTRSACRKTVIDCNNSAILGLDVPDPDHRPGHRFSSPIPSLAERLAADVPDARVVKAFNTIPAAVLGLEREELALYRVSVFPCSDDPQAKAVVKGLAEELGFVGVDSGGLERARLVEAVARRTWSGPRGRCAATRARSPWTCSIRRR